ncbi:MAG: efflux RND transporter permease subunit [Fluviicoccus sp.]|uniref:efflux RND transporter permease subunit n=1 Tax=Fluviicoccus sp. TaxID=2003552 RepID=UPI00271F90B1|nr:efflux RND transporter permease subunit [Fluviicoccus sp.]MDO8330034.1 efflux RND transporter permease subunit [Fluviicoccus sp.]
MWLTRLCIRYPVFATMMMMAFMVLGLFAWRELSVEEYPNVEFPYAVITTDYPGASPAVVESDVTRRIEDAINTVPGVKRIISTSFEGRSRIAVEFVLGVPIEVAVQDVRDKIAAVKVRFRPEVKEPLVERFRPDEAPVFSLAFVTDSLSVKALSTHVTQQVVRKLQNIPGVGRVDVVGAMPREIQVELMPDRMEALGVGIDEVMAALRSENAQMPAGTVEVGSSEKMVEINGRIASPEEFAGLIVAQRGQSAVTLGQVARIIDGEQELQSLALLNGRRAISVDVVKMSGANTIALVDALHQQVPEIEASLPSGSRVLVVADSSRSIRASLHDVKKTLVEGAVLAIVIVFLFLGSWRSTIITGLTLPISLLGCIFFLYVFGLSLNSMTLMALSLSIGLLIDDAIVVRENIVRHAAMGKSHGQAAVDGTREIGLAVLATTLTIVAVFLPVAFMGGIIGRFFYQFGIAVSCAVLLSMLVSFTLDPMLSSRWRDPDAHGMQGDSWMAVKLRAFQAQLDRLAEKYAQVILWALNNRRFTLGLAVGSLAVAMLFAKFVGKEFVPEPDLSEISIKFSTPVGSTLGYTEQKAAQVGLLVRQFPGVLDTYATINTGLDIGKHKASVRVLLKPKAERTLSQKQLINTFREQLKAVAGIEVNSVAPAKETIGSLKPIQVSLQGNDMQVLQRLAQEFQHKLGAVPGLIDLESSMKASRPTLSLQVDRERAADLGLSVGRIGAALRPLIAGETVTTWQDADGENYNVRVRLPGNLRQSAEDVTLLPVASGRINPLTGQPEMITVGQVATVKESVSAAQINRRNLFREVLFSGNVTGRPAGDVGADIEKVAAGIAMPAGYRIVTQGANNDMKESVGYATTALVLGALFIYMLLGAQFNSFLHPLTIMTALPLSLIGVFMALFVCRSSLNMFSIIGIVMLMGLVTKNAILLVDFIQELVKSGLPREKAILQAGQTRLRPILMTTAAMIAGMIPLALGLGEGAEQRAPMAHALIGGLLTSTVLTLIVVPVMYTCLDDLVRAVPRLAFILRKPARALPGSGKTIP